MITQDKIRELRELHAKGAQEEWEAIADAVITKERATPIAIVSSYKTETAQSITVLHNAAPDLFDIAEEAIRLRELVKVMRDALEKVRPEIERASRRLHDGTNGHLIRRERKAELEVIDAALALASKEVAS